MSRSKKTLRVRVISDPDPVNPRKDDGNIGTMVCWHRRYSLGDQQPAWSPSEFNWRLMQTREQSVGRDVSEDLSPECAQEYVEKWFVVLPLYLYDHSGLVMNTAGFSCPWDSGQVGHIYSSLETAGEAYGCKAWESLVAGAAVKSLLHVTIERLTREVEIYSCYLEGAVYAWLAEKPVMGGWETLEFEGGFYGYDHEDSGLMGSIPEKYRSFLVKETA